MDIVNEVDLSGCGATPLSGYLKALGLLRLLSSKEIDIRVAWRSRGPVLVTRLSADEVVHYLLHDYVPTPVFAPWNGGSGFFEKDNKQALQAIISSTTQRFNPYRESLHLADVALKGVPRNSSPKGMEKARLLTKLRGLLPDAALEWLDAAVVLSRDVALYPPLLGTGGNDGRLDFTNNFMQRLVELIDPDSGLPKPHSERWLRASVFGDVSPGLIKKAIGQFSPAQVGGPNATNGFEADSLINPWDYILTIEGALAFAAVAVRRNADDPQGVLSYPFTVRTVAAGAGNLGEGDAASSRGELWMPLWPRPASYAEVRTLLGEGRVVLDRKPARDALDFVRAVQQLGGYRGVTGFQRFGLLQRSGKAHLATPLGRITVAETPRFDWAAALDKNDWLTRFRRFAQGDNAPGRCVTLRRELENQLFDLAGRTPRPEEAQEFLRILGEISAVVSASDKARESVPPVPRLPGYWAQMANDSSPAFRIARALAGLHGVDKVALPLAAQLFPVHPKRNIWMEEARKAAWAESDPYCRIRLHTGRGRDLQTTLLALLKRRLWLFDRLDMVDKPLHSNAAIDLDDFWTFLQGKALDERIFALLPGLSLCRIDSEATDAPDSTSFPAAVALLKICVTPVATLRHFGWLGEKERLPVPPGLLSQLAAGNANNRAVAMAWRRLRAGGLAPLFQRALPELGTVEPARVAAALLIPLQSSAVRWLGDYVLNVPSHAA